MDTEMNALSAAKARYAELLVSQTEGPEFYQRIIGFVSQYPYYFGPYLEMIDYLEAGRLYAERKEFIRFSLGRIEKFLSTPAFMQEARRTLSKYDSAFMLAILDRAGISYRNHPLWLLRARNFHASLPDEPAREAKYLLPIKSGLDTAPLKKEIAENE